MLKKLLLLTTLVLVSFISKAQNKYYILRDGKIINEYQYEKAVGLKLDSISKGLGDVENFKDGFNQQFDIVKRNKDSMIFRVTWSNSRKPKKLRANYSKYKPIKENENFTLLKKVTIDKDSIDLESLKGKPTLINFWFTACAPCVAEIEILNELKKEFGNKVNFIAITYNPRDIVEDFLKTKPFHFKHITNATDEIDFWEINNYPQNIFLDKNGKIVKVTESVPSIKKGGKNIYDKKSFKAILNTLLIAKP